MHAPSVSRLVCLGLRGGQTDAAPVGFPLNQRYGGIALQRAIVSPQLLKFMLGANAQILDESPDLVAVEGVGVPQTY